MNTLSAQKAISHEYDGARNFITPQVIKYGKINRNLAFELSSGRGIFDDNTMYGVSIVSIISHEYPIETKRMTELSNSFQSRRAADVYIESLKE